MNKEWLLGFIEGEGCFCIPFAKVNRDNKYRIWADFSIKLTKSEEQVLEGIKHFLGGIGNIYHQDNTKVRETLKNAKDELIYKITKLSEIKQIINLLKTTNFVTKSKKREFEIWCECVELIDKKKHLTKEGILKIALLRELMNKRSQWNRQSFCKIKNNLEPCENYHNRNSCNICKKDVEASLNESIS